jgi:multidrug transporter EmrE-like cation transporter
MRKFQIFALRLFLAVIFAFLISRLFFEEIAFIKIVGLALILLGLAYLFEYTRKR